MSRSLKLFFLRQISLLFHSLLVSIDIIRDKLLRVTLKDSHDAPPHFQPVSEHRHNRSTLNATVPGSSPHASSLRPSFTDLYFYYNGSTSMGIATDPDTNDQSKGKSSDDKFRYQALDSEKREIRLCSFTELAEASENLTATLQAFELHHSPPYTALSYEWGDATGNASVLLGGAKLAIRQNLAKFLTTLLRLDFHDTYFWIDQICIDQDSIVERNHQVRLMSEIYSNAEEVIAWISDALPDPRRRHLKFKTELTLASYWRRLWIAQELLLARNIRACGFSGIVEWDQIVSWALPGRLPSPEAILNLLGEEFWWAESGPGFKFWNFVFLRHLGSVAFPLSLVQAINKFSESECSNPRDKIYGLLGLVIPEQRIEVDYNITPRVLMYKGLAKALSVGGSDQTPEGIIRIIFRSFALKIGLRETEWQRIDLFIAKYRGRGRRITQSRSLIRKRQKGRLEPRSSTAAESKGL